MGRLAPLLLLAALSAQAAFTVTDGVTVEECAQVTITKLGCTPKAGPPPAQASTAHLTNLSTRGLVLTDPNVMIGGFTLDGEGAQTVLVRARGPSLAAFGVPNTLFNPVLQLFAGGALIAINDDWVTAANAAEVIATGKAPSSELESAILITLVPGAYTAIVTGAGGATGIAIIEVFVL